MTAAHDSQHQRTSKCVANHQGTNHLFLKDPYIINTWSVKLFFNLVNLILYSLLTIYICLCKIYVLKYITKNIIYYCYTIKKSSILLLFSTNKWIYHLFGENISFISRLTCVYALVIKKIQDNYMAKLLDRLS